MVYPVDSLGIANDSAFWAAYNTPNPLAFRGGRQSVDTTSTVPTSPSTNIVVEEKKNSRARWVLGSLFTIGAAAFCIAAHKKGPEGAKFFQRIGEGAKTIIRNGRNRFIPEHPTVSKEGDKVVMRFAGEKNRMNSTKAATELSKIGESYTPNKLSDIAEKVAGDGDGIVRKLQAGNEVRAFDFTHDAGEGKKYFVGAESKNSGNYRIFEIMSDGTKADVTKTLEKDNAEAFKAIQGKIRSYRIGEGNLAELDNVYIRTTNPTTGLVTQTKYSGLEKDGELLHATSDKFGLGSDKVDAYLADHEGAKKIIDAVKDDKTNDLKVAFAERVVPEIGTFKLDKNGHIVEIIENGKTKPIKPGDDRFKALMQRAKDTDHSFDKISNDRTKWTKTRYYA